MATTVNNGKEKKKKSRGIKRSRESPPRTPTSTLIDAKFNQRSALIKKWLQSAYQNLVARCYKEQKEDWLELCLIQCNTIDRWPFGGGEGCLVPGCDSGRLGATLIGLEARHPSACWQVLLGGITIPVAYGTSNMHAVCGECETHMKEELTAFNLEHLPLVRFTSARARQTLDETCNIPRVIIQLICEYHCSPGLFF